MSVVGLASGAALPSRRRLIAAGSILVAVGCGRSAVAPIAVETVWVSPSTVTLVEGDSTKLATRALGASGNPISGRAVTWTTDDTAVVAVRADGTVVARRNGRTTVRAHIEGRIGTALVEVLPRTRVPRLHGIEPSQAMEGDGPTELVLSGQDFLAGARIVWNGTAYDAAEASATRLTLTLGEEAFRAPGTATVAVVNPEPEPGVSNALTFPIVRAPVTDVDIEPDSLRLAISQVATLSLSVRGPGGRPLTGRTVTWSSSAPQYATVDAEGRVTGRAGGSARIAASVEGVTDEIEVRVDESRTPVAFVIPVPTRAAVLVGGAVQFSARVLGPTGGELMDRTVEWWVEASDIATIDNQGVAVGLRRGTTRVRATSEGVQGWAVLEVREVPIGSVHVYDLRFTDLVKPVVGDTVWTVPGSGPQPAALVLDSASLQLDFETGTYSQSFTLAVLVGFDRVDEIEQVDEGLFGYTLSGALQFTSTTEVGRTFTAVPAGPGALLVTQTVHRRPEAPYEYVIR